MAPWRNPIAFIPEGLRSKTALHFAVILAVVVVGTFAFAWVDGQSLADSFYFIVMVMTLIGAANPHTFAGQLVGIAVAVISVGVILSLMTQVLGPAALTAYWEGHRLRRVSRMKDHIVICGSSDTARVLLRRLPKDQVIAVVKDKGAYDALTEAGVPTLEGDYETAEVLRKAGVAESRAVIAASQEDSENAFICLTSKKIARQVPVFVTVSSQENADKLKEVRADHIISPALLSADAILRDLHASRAPAP